MKNEQSRKVKVMSNLSYFAIASALGMMFLLFYFLFTPSSFWFKYIEIAPTKEAYSSEEKLQFFSIAEFYSEYEVLWRDVLKCKTEGDGYGFGFFSVYESSAVAKATSTLPENNSPWTYHAAIPKRDSVCYLDSTITIKLPFGITKTQRYDGAQHDQLFKVESVNN